jgi:pimeloyl-ACP methyl ester carboxylesterase
VSSTSQPPAVTIEGVGHYPMLEKPDEFNRLLREALKEFATKM